jgi:hypothetical protein
VKSCARFHRGWQHPVWGTNNARKCGVYTHDVISIPTGGCMAEPETNDVSMSNVCNLVFHVIRLTR